MKGGGGGGGGGFTKKMMNPLKGGKELLEDGKTPAGKDVSRLVHDRSYFSNLVKSLLRLESYRFRDLIFTLPSRQHDLQI